MFVSHARTYTPTRPGHAQNRNTATTALEAGSGQGDEAGSGQGDARVEYTETISVDLEGE
jgi:hypothetical protein